MPLERATGQRDIRYHLITKDYMQSKLCVTGKCYFAGIIFTAMNGESAVEVVFNIYDSGTAASSTKRLVPRTFKKVWAAGADNFFALSYDPPIRAVNGIYVHLQDVVGRVQYQIIYDQ